MLAGLVWPPQSPFGGGWVSRPGQLDPAGWTAVDFLDRPWCVSCGYPFAYDAGEVVCGACAARPLVLGLMRAAFVYNEASRKLVLDFKHGGRTETLPQFARWMARAGAEALEGADALVPVPLHPRRLLSRRYNQSSLLASALTRETGIPVEADALRRSRATTTQGGKSAKGRKRNVAGAFRVRERYTARITGKCLVLVDDVMTTGATLEACARVLLRAGARQVNAVALSRVVRPVNPLT
ncbi:ComF family protein [Hyphobacterium marinum]|uniref:ComF family protein n=1 Tax=Hyphobacterium marinum TaxID=3116574 RepID=A0ABU7LXJ2_9PROT|nr:ComF family protein [Hyphobacterium sp. Y6023]MEE2566244.1 ComF family protein [Hyphobacterium sp. Y6023]